jgi:hypothetical protein
MRAICCYFKTEFSFRRKNWKNLLLVKRWDIFVWCFMLYFSSLQLTIYLPVFKSIGTIIIHQSYTYMLVYNNCVRLYWFDLLCAYKIKRNKIDGKTGSYCSQDSPNHNHHPNLLLNGYMSLFRSPDLCANFILPTTGIEIFRLYFLCQKFLSPNQKCTKLLKQWKLRGPHVGTKIGDLLLIASFCWLRRNALWCYLNPTFSQNLFPCTLFAVLTLHRLYALKNR